MADKDVGKKSRPPRAPLKVTLTALAVGCAWAAWHAPQNLSLPAPGPAALVWLVDSVTAALVALCVLEVLAAVLGSGLQLLQTGLRALRR